MYNLNDAKYVALILNISFENFTINDFLKGINFESKRIYNYDNDHLSILIKIAKIVVVKLNKNSKHYHLENCYSIMI